MNLLLTPFLHGQWTVTQAAVKFPLWMGVSTVFYSATNSVQALIDNIYALDLQLVSIKKVLNNSDISSVFDNATVAAVKYGQTIENTLKSLGEISKLGFDLGEAEELNNNSMLLSTVGEFKDTTDAANYLVAVMRQYKLEVSDTIDVVNALNSVSNQTVATTEGIAQALSKSSANAAMAGVSFHELTGIVSQTVETLKISGNEAGTFYKTLFSRYLREESQSMIEGLGIKTKEMSGELRSTTDVLAELGSQWETFDAQTKNAISSQFGGGWHVAKVTSLLENQARVAENTIFSMDSYNSAVNEMKVFEGELEYQTNQMIASFQLLSQTIGDNGVRQLIVGLLNSVTSLTTDFAS
ncbi:phage tail tape measure protein [Bacillus sp. JJ722]|uniref:phage tail tape measure protein n=1 Tax=Bacillus sp. JJ722 TaxID=3122973 RepID=UPI0030001E0D